MVYYIFSFSYLEKNKIKDLKSSFSFNSLSEISNLNFLTKKNVDSFFLPKYSSLKDILSGKYLIFSLNNESLTLNELLKNLELIQDFLKSFDNDIHLFTVVYNNSYYFNDFLIESNKYKTKEILNLTKLQNSYLLLHLLKIESIKYLLYFSRINNLKINKNYEYLSYYL
jgi:hypothetical protein